MAQILSRLTNPLVHLLHIDLPLLTEVVYTIGSHFRVFTKCGHGRPCFASWSETLWVYYARDTAPNQYVSLHPLL